MRRLFRTLLMAAALLTITVNAGAQNAKQRISREQLAQTQARHIADRMAMDDATTDRFVDTYCRFQQELWALGPRTPTQQPGNNSDEQTERDIKQRFEHSQKILNLRQKYYDIYSEFLTQKQIKRVYELERQMMNRLHKRNDRNNARGNRTTKRNAR